ncbi:MAG: glycine cleavage system aminomethyltransferase GcvT [Pirellulales bacterium]|nr:glycine cleavage system aminomethyltransferase GcvT [Pirellulales bacterium]
MTQTLLTTPLTQWHAGHGGRMVDFAGWSMPVQYTSIVEEHNATRNAVGMFDISHMGRLRLDGEAAGEYLDSLVTRRVVDAKPGRIRYALVTNNHGGIRDDVLVYHLQDATGGSYWLMVVNAGNREKILGWINEHPMPAGVTMSDLTMDWAMIAVQGPKALPLLQPLVEADLASMKYYTGCETKVAGHGGIVSRTGYTGEDGCELIVGANVAAQIWESLLESGCDAGAQAAGLGARDTLRLEAGMPLYGHELNEEITPLQAGLSFAVTKGKINHPGADQVFSSADDPSLPRLVGLRLEGKRVPREGYNVVSNGEQIGTVSSGTFSPTMQCPLAMAYLSPAHTDPGTKVHVDVRGSELPATVEKLPFYKREKE